MNGRAIPAAEMNTFRLTNVIPERIILLAEVSLYMPSKRTLMSDILPHFLFHYLEIRTTVFIRNICMVGARTRVNPHARCQSP